MQRPTDETAGDGPPGSFLDFDSTDREGCER